MTSSFLSSIIGYLVTAVIASLLTTLFIDLTSREAIHLGRTRLGRENLLLKEQKNKNESSKNVKVEKVILKKAVKLGALCLNGSPPGYHFRKGIYKLRSK